jgi:hypothetical protein
MTHSLNGHILIPEPLKATTHYDARTVNNLAIEFMLKNFEEYIADRHIGSDFTQYRTHSEEPQFIKTPIINILDAPTVPYELIQPLRKSLEDTLSGRYLLVASVESGSHVYFSDTDLAMEIFNTTRKLRDVLRLELKLPLRTMRTVFDDNQRCYLPGEFRQKIETAKGLREQIFGETSQA